MEAKLSEAFDGNPGVAFLICPSLLFQSLFQASCSAAVGFLNSPMLEGNDCGLSLILQRYRFGEVREMENDWGGKASQLLFILPQDHP